MSDPSRVLLREKCDRSNNKRVVPMVASTQNSVFGTANDHIGAVGAALEVDRQARPGLRPPKPYPPEQLQPVDIHVGVKIRDRREALGLTQSELATRIGVTGQQIHRYESGVDRVGAGRIWELGQVLGCRVSSFFDGLEAAVDTATPVVGRIETQTSAQASQSKCETAQNEATEVVRLYHCIGDSVVQRRIMELARALASKGRNRSSATRGR